MRSGGLLDAPGVTVRPIAADLGIGASVLGRWRRALRQHPQQAVVGKGRSRDEELSQLRRELARVTKERDFFARSGRVLRERVDVTVRLIPRSRDVFSLRWMGRCVRVAARG